MRDSRLRIGIQAPLGFASGLPLLLTSSTLTAWLASEGISIKTIGLFAFVALPYNFKFLWAPLLDRYQLFRIGRRKSWMFATQLLLCLTIFGLGALNVVSAPQTVAIFALLIAFLSASQDIVVDAYRTDILKDTERGRGTATYVAGYRYAMIIAGAGALLVADHLSWTLTYWLLAGFMAMSMIATWMAPQPPSPPIPATLRASVIVPIRDLFARKGIGMTIAIVALYKLGDSLAAHLISPFLIQLDFSLTEIGLVHKGLGMAATIIGCAIAGTIADKIGIRRGLLIFGIAQSLGNIGYLGLALVGYSKMWLLTAIGIDNLCNGLGTAAFVAYLMSLCNRRFSATQYALLTSASSLLGRVFTPVGAAFADGYGWISFFISTIVIAIPALILIAICIRRNDPESLIQP